MVSIHLSVLMTGCFSFVCCLLLHVFFWRIKHPRNHAGALLSIFFVPGAFFIFLASFFWGHFSNFDLFAVILLHASLSCAYIQFYPASQADSPSLKILTVVGKSMPGGITGAEIQAQFDPAQLFTARVRDLLEAQLVNRVNGNLVITPKGRAFISPFLLLRKLLGLTAGKG